MQRKSRRMLAEEQPVVAETPAPATERARILAVDDDERNLLAISEVLAGTGEVVSARSGEEALRCLLKGEFAVILLDVLMPGIDGYETAALIRQREQSRHTPIIFLSAINKEHAHMLRGYDAGAVDFVFKPFDPLILRSKVTVFVDLFEKTCAIREQAAIEQRLVAEKLDAQAATLSAEQALLASERRQASILKSLPMAVYVEKEDDAGPVFIGGNIQAVTGFAEETVRDDPQFWLSRVHPDDHPRLAPLFRSGGVSREYRWRHADGGYRHFLEQGVPIGDGQLAGTITDVTERRQLESRLMQTQRLDAIGKLTGGLAHDFNNLLAAILSGIGLLERRANLDRDCGRVLEMMGRSARQGAELVNRMLSFSRRQQLRPAAVGLAELSDTMNGLVGPVLGSMIHFEWRVGETEVWPVHVDAGQLELTLMNLVFNARDAMPSGGTITVVAENRPDTPASDDLAAGDYVVLSVSDTGSGIEPELVSKVIEPFFTTKAIGKGTGLGLSTAYGFARQSGGTLRIDSVVGQGTSMQLWLPRSAEAPDRQVQINGQLRPEAPKLDSPLSVLLVDDSSNLRELTARSLSDRGFSVTTAAGGAEALQLIERDPQQFDVIVTDFAMPLVSGLDVVRFARRLRADWPAVIITGYAESDAIKDRPLDVPVLVKPFTESDLAEHIIAARRAPA